MTKLTDFYIHPISEPRIYPISYLQDNELFPILISGIVNPNGPTLTVVTAVRDGTSAPLALVYAYLNPFGSELFIPGYLREGQLNTPLPDQILQALQSYEIFAGGIPTLCIPAGYLDPFDVRYLYSHLFSNNNNPQSVYQRLKRFPLNPWDRVSEEMSEAMEQAEAYLKEEQITQAGDEDEAMSDDDMNSLLDIVLDSEHNQKELPAFMYAWKGSIEQQRTLSNDALADSAFQFDDFNNLLARILVFSGYRPG